LFYFEILEALYSKKVKYLIVGGLAVNLHGIPRVTQDIDIIISMEKENIFNLLELLKDLGYIPRLPVDPKNLLDPILLNEWINNRNLKAFSFYNKNDNFKEIDIVLVHPLNFEVAYERRIKKRVEDIEINLIAMDDLITMKMHAGRNQDLSDVKLLERLKEELGK